MNVSQAGGAQRATASFVVVKGYHMGSKWFADAFNHIHGAAFFFEYEHCLRKLAPQPHVLAGPETTLGYLRHGCGCAESCHGCRAGELPPVQPAVPGGGAHRARASRVHAAESAHAKHCLATGVSFGALGASYVAHLGAMLRLEPRLSIVLHVRSNHVKHGLSFLRVTCPSQPNHATAATAAHRMRMPPALLLARSVTAARSQAKVSEQAASLAGGRVAYTVVYEAMQRDLDGEMRRLLGAIGAPPAAQGSVVRGGSLVKAGSDDLAEVLANFGEVEQHLRSLPCLHSMLVARGPVAFEADACREEIGSFSEAVASEVAATRASGRLELNASDCNVR